MIMNSINWLLSIVAVFILIGGCEKDNSVDFTYTEYPDYFVSYQGNTDNQGEFFIFNDTSELNSIFHPAATMDDNIWIKSDDFKNKIAIGIIKEFNNVCNCPNLTITSIEYVDNKVVFKYNLAGFDNTENISCDMICRPNLLVMIDSVTFTSIEFYENDILVRTIDK